LLRGRDLRDEAIEIRLELGVGLDAQRVGGAFDDLVDVGIVEGIARGRLVLDLLATEDGGRPLEVVDALRLLALLEGEWDRDRPVDLDPRQPEGVGEVHRGEGHRLHGIVAGRLSGGFRRPRSMSCRRYADAQGQWDRERAWEVCHNEADSTPLTR